LLCEDGDEEPRNTLAGGQRSRKCTWMGYWEVKSGNWRRGLVEDEERQKL